MRLLGIIRNIGEARQWMTQTGPVTIYQVTFEAEGNTFLGDLFASASYITNRGICPGAVGYFDLAFKVRDVTTKAGEVYKRQDIRFSDFRLANQNLTGAQAPATEEPEPSQAEQHVDLKLIEGQKVETPIEQAQQSEEVQINPVTGLPF